MSPHRQQQPLQSHENAKGRLFKTNPSRAMLGDFAEMSVKMADRVLVEIAREQDEIGE